MKKKCQIIFFTNASLFQVQSDNSDSSGISIATSITSYECINPCDQFENINHPWRHVINIHIRILSSQGSLNIQMHVIHRRRDNCKKPVHLSRGLSGLRTSLLILQIRENGNNLTLGITLTFKLSFIISKGGFIQSYELKTS